MLERSLVLEHQRLIGHPVAAMRGTSLREVDQGHDRISYGGIPQAGRVIIPVVRGQRRVTRSGIQQRRKSR